MSATMDNEKNYWSEYDSVAIWCAKRNLAGYLGETLPIAISQPVVDMINDDIEAFQRRIREAKYALAMERISQ